MNILVHVSCERCENACQLDIHLEVELLSLRVSTASTLGDETKLVF